MPCKTKIRGNSLSSLNKICLISRYRFSTRLWESWSRNWYVYRFKSLFSMHDKNIGQSTLWGSRKATFCVERPSTSSILAISEMTSWQVGSSSTMRNAITLQFTSSNSLTQYFLGHSNSKMSLSPKTSGASIDFNWFLVNTSMFKIVQQTHELFL